VELDWPRKDGVTLRATLGQVEKQTGETKIEEHPPPEEAEYLFNWFWQVHQGRAQGFSGPLPLDAKEIKAWAELSGISLTPWEFQVIRKMDRAFLDTVAEIKS
jgi:hypothetical protein